MTPRQWNKLCGIVTDRMKEFTRPFVTPLIYEALGKKVRYGSGTYIEFPDSGTGEKSLLTCEHVARYHPLQHRPYGCQQPISVSGIMCADRHPCDVATVKISKRIWLQQAHGAKPLSTSKFTQEHKPVKDEILFFRGLAGENAYFGFGGFDCIITGYCTQEKRTTGDKDVFEIFWEPSKTRITPNTDFETQKRLRHESAAGFSGSLVWNTRFVEMGCDIDAWNPSDAVVTGLLRRWDTKGKTLLGWRIEHVNAWLASRPRWA